MATVYSRLEQPAKALSILKQALAIQEEVGDKFHAGITLRRIVGNYLLLKDYPHAIEWAQKALSWNQELKNRVEVARTLMGISYISRSQNKPAEVRQYLNQALSIFKESEIHPTEIIILQLIGSDNLFNDIDQAIENYKKALIVAHENQLYPQEIKSLELLIFAYQKRISKYDHSGLASPKKADYAQILELSQSALNLARVLNKPESEAKALISLGFAYSFLGESQKAETVSLQAADIARKIKAEDTEKDAVSALHNIYANQGNYHKAVEMELRELEIEQKQNNINSVVPILSLLAGDYLVLGEYQKAIDRFQQVLAMVQKIEVSKLDPYLQSFPLTYKLSALGGLSQSYESLGEYDKALEFAQQEVKTAQTFHKPDLEADALLQLASVYQDTFGNLPKALEISKQALKIAQQIKNHKIEAKALKELGNIYVKQGNYPQALESANQILAIAQRWENPKLEDDALSLFWDIYDRQGNYQKALATAKEELTVLQTANIHKMEIHAWFHLTQSYLSLGNTTKAEETGNQGLKITRELKNSNYESLALIHLSIVYQAEGKYEQGIEVLQNALKIWRRNKYFDGEVIATTGLSTIYEKLGEYQKVIAVAEPNLTNARKINDRVSEGQLLINLGNAYSTVGDYPKAKDFIEQGLKIARELKNPALESIALDSLGTYYTSLNNYQKALELSQQSLKIAQDLKSPPLMVNPEFSLGNIYNSLGDYVKSREFYQQALNTSRQLKSRQGEGIALFAEAGTYFAQNEPQKTVELSQQALNIFREIKVPRLEAFATIMLSIGYGELGNDAKAIEAAQRFLTFAKTTQNPVWSKLALSTLGDLHRKFGRKEQAIDILNQAIAIKTDNQVTGNDWGIYVGLGRTYADLKQPVRAILYYKQGIDKIEEVRHGIQGLPPQLQEFFLKATVDFDQVKTADIYRQLAELLISQGRNVEAQQVLELLKVQEISEFNGTRGQKNEIPRTPKETAIQKAEGSLIAFGQRLDECEQQKCSKITELRNQRDDLNREFTKKIKEIEQSYNGKDPNLIYPGNFLDAAGNIVKQPGTVLIYPLVSKDKISILWASKGVVIKAVEINGVGKSQLDSTVSKFRDLLQNPNSNTAEVKATGKQLYDWLIKPLEPELKANKIQNLVFALDSSTRYIPMSAVFDGNQYLVENYNVSTVISAGLTNMSDRLPPGTQNTQVLALGVSDSVAGFPALGNVPKELAAIVHTNTQSQGIYLGLEFLNQQFSWEALRDNVQGKKILHIATHGAFKPNNPEDSYLLLGTGKKLPISEINLLQNLGDVHLVVLSACETARGGANQNGVEISGISSYFLGITKAKAVMASLWQVNDSSTAVLMQQFYQNISKSTAQTPITKAEALRDSQLSLLRGQTTSQKANSRRTDEGSWILPTGSNTPTRHDTAPGFSHPYYWAPFILIGNGL